MDQANQSLSEAIGEERLVQLNEAIIRLQSLALGFPDQGSLMVLFERDAPDLEGPQCEEQISQTLRDLEPDHDWTWVTAQRDDDRSVYWASPFFAKETDGTFDVTAFLLLDILSRLSAWWLYMNWRAFDLAASSLRELNERRYLPSAANARGMLEGVAAFVTEGNRLQALWESFKAKGIPSHSETMNFRMSIHHELFQPQFASRTDRKDTNPRKNIVTIIDRYARDTVSEIDIASLYGRLSDAVHPSLGSNQSYWRRTGGLEVGWFIEMERRVGDTRYPAKGVPSARNAADAVIASVADLEFNSSRLQKFIWDVGLTSGASYSSLVPFFGTTKRLGPTDRCPCGSGLLGNSCRHTWGNSGDQP